MKQPAKNPHELEIPDEQARPLLSGGGYRKLHRTVVMSTALVAVVPLIIMTVVNYDQYQQTLHDRTIESIQRLLTNNKQSIEFFLSERRSALMYLIRERSFEELCDPGALGQIMRNMNESFPLGTFVDLGIIDSSGRQRCYKGPHDLQGREYTGQHWFQQVDQLGMYISDVFLGHRRSPHFAIAIRQAWKDDDFYILRATFGAEMLRRQIHFAGLHLNEDIFLINHDGVLQTPSRRYGKALVKIPLDPPHLAPGVDVQQTRDRKGQRILLGSASIKDSPFMLMFAKPIEDVASGWQVSARLFGFLAVSVLLILVVILWGARQFINRIRAENLRRASMMHKVEYSNKLASIGRLAAGVAHEINNPLAVINEKSGLLKDLVSARESGPDREKYLSVLDSVLGSVKRCTTITHRLLGFARRMDVRHEEIDLPSLLEEVVGFIGKEAEYRNINITIETGGLPPAIVSDRGQLQQVFLNLVNNAVGAIEKGGNINLRVEQISDKQVEILISDDGVGIPTANLKRIFEPFFTTKEGSGTGLGLSITYGIVNKLGGEITVESTVGKGTQFIVRLPVNPEG